MCIPFLTHMSIESCGPLHHTKSTEKAAHQQNQVNIVYYSSNFIHKRVLWSLINNIQFLLLLFF